MYNFSNRMSSLKASAIREILKHTSGGNCIAFAAGNPSPEAFPEKEIREITGELLESSAVASLQYGISEGFTPLRTFTAQRLYKKFCVGTEADDLIIVSGGQQGIELTCKILCNEGDTVICENPSFIGALNAFKSYGVNLCGVPLQSDGIDVEALEKALKTEKNVKLMYLIPTFQNPGGTTMSSEKRNAVYALAKKYGCMILEDNPYAELRFKGQEVKPIKALDTDGLVIYCGSYSKVMSPGMRVGFVCAPQEIISKMVVAKQVSDVHTNNLFQMLIATYLDKYDFDAHVESLQELYRRKCALMVDGIHRHYGERVSFTEPEGGLFMWCTLRKETDIYEYTKKALGRGVAIVPGHAFMTKETDPCNSFRLNFSTPTDEEIVRGIEILGEIPF